MNLICKYSLTCGGCCSEECRDRKEVSAEEAHAYYEEMISRGFGNLHD